MKFQQLSVKTQVYAGFGSLVAVAMGLAVFGIDRLSRIDTQVGLLGQFTDNNNRAQEIAFRFESMRRNSLRYKTDGNPAALATLQGDATTADELLTQSAATGLAEERRQIYRTILAQMALYHGALDQLVTFQTQVTQERAKLFTGGDALSAALDRFMKAAETVDDPAVYEAAVKVERAVLLVRVANWRFLATNDAKGPATFNVNRENAEAAIAKLDQLAGEKIQAELSTVKAAIGGYAQSFDAVAASILDSNDLYDNQIRPQVDVMQTELKHVKELLAASFRQVRDESQAIVANANLLQMIFSALTLAFGTGLALLIGRGIANPIRAMTATMGKLATGDTTIDIPSSEGKNEIGDMARAVVVFKANMIQATALATEQATEQAGKEARQQLVNGHIQSFDRMVRGLLETLASASTEMRTTAQSMSTTAEQTNQQAGVVSLAADQASANVQTMAAATEEMASSAAEIARQVSRSTTIAARAVDAARATDRQVQGLADSAQKIEAVVAIINNIASQTNLLALNATIEAARAGDAGKGFAVVASEVKALASQTARATEEIGSQIQAIQGATQAAVEAIKGIGATIDEMNDISTAIAAAMEEQGATTSEMTRSTQEAARGTQEVSSTISDVSQGARATGAAANQVLSAAGELGNKTDTLRTAVDGFLNKIRAAA